MTPADSTITLDGSLAGARILVVDDDFLIRLHIESLLMQHGAVVLTADGVGSALRMGSEERLDLALLDVDLGGEDSGGVAALLAARNVPVIAVTGYPGDSLDGPWRDRPIVAKPIDEKELQTVIATALAAAARPPA